MEENSNTKEKIWQVCHFRKRSVLKLDLNEFRGGSFREEEEGPSTGTGRRWKQRGN